MSIEIIPAGASAVVTDRHRDHDFDNKACEIIGAIKDAEANLNGEDGNRYADIVKTVKDAEAQLDRSSGDRFIQTVQDIKDAEARLERGSAEKFIHTIQDIKDAETRLDRSAGDRFIDTIQDIKAAELESVKSDCQTRDVVREGFKGVADEVCGAVNTIKDAVNESRRELLYHQLGALKDTMLEFKSAQGLAYKLAAEADKTACNNQMQVLLQFKDQALLSEKIAANASRELAECCCEIREAISADGQKTRDLINSQEVDRLRDRAAKAEAGLAAYFARNTSPVVPVV